MRQTNGPTRVIFIRTEPAVSSFRWKWGRGRKERLNCGRSSGPLCKQQRPCGMQNEKGLTLIGFSKALPDTLTNACTRAGTHTHTQKGDLWVNTPGPSELYWLWDQTDRLVSCMTPLNWKRAYGRFQHRFHVWNFGGVLQSAFTAIIPGAAVKAVLVLLKVCESQNYSQRKMSTCNTTQPQQVFATRPRVYLKQQTVQRRENFKRGTLYQ